MTNLSTASKSDLAAEVPTWAERARALKITDAATCVNASHLLRSIKGLRTEIANWFSPHLDAAMETKRKAEAARKGLADERDRMEAPLVEAENLVKRTLLNWETEQERLRREEEKRLQAEAQREAEEQTLNAAAALEMDANSMRSPEVAEEMRQEAADILAQPIEAPVVSVNRFVPKVQGVVYRDNWKAHPEINVRQLAAAVASGAVPPTFLTPNLTAINQFARATQGAQPVAGVKFFNDRQIAARG